MKAPETKKCCLCKQHVVSFHKFDLSYGLVYDFKTARKPLLSYLYQLYEGRQHPEYQYRKKEELDPIKMF